MASEREHLLRRLYEAGRASSRLSVLLRSAAAAELGITVTDGECLDFLLEAGAATAGQIASQTNLTTGAVTSMIRRLQRAGYVTSSRDPADRRRVIVTPVPDRLTAAAEVYAAYLRQVDALTETYTDDQLAFLASHYQNLTAIYRNVLKEHSSR